METKYILPADIEKESMRIIGEELDARGITVEDDIVPIVKRVIHTTADFYYAENLVITEGTSKRAIKALKSGGKTIITDTNMAYSGISKPSLGKLECEAKCYMAEPEIKDIAKKNGTTRAVASMEKGASDYPDCIFAVGNAPTALIKVADMIRDGLKPSLVIGVPVGFVNVVESKEYALDVCKEFDIPAIMAMGRKGGSNVAATIVNALLYMATDTVDPDKRW